MEGGGPQPEHGGSLTASLYQPAINVPAVPVDTQNPEVTVVVPGAIGGLHEVAVRAQEAIGILINGETRFTEAELDRLVALKEALDALPPVPVV